MKNSKLIKSFFIFCLFASVFGARGMSLIRACKEGNVEDVKFLLQDSNIDVNKRNMLSRIRPPLTLACSGNHIDIVKLLLNHKDIDVNGGYYNPPLLFACSGNRIDIVELLLERKDIRVNYGGRKPLIVACERGNIEVVKLLLKNKEINVNIRKDWKTPLCVSCKNGHIDIVKLLLENKKINVNWGNMYEQFPLDFACEEGHVDIVKLLLENGAKVNCNTLEKAESNDLILYFCLFVLEFEVSKDKKKFIDEFIDSIKKKENKDELLNFLLSFVFVRSMREFFKNKKLSFEETVFYKFYEINNKRKENKINFKDALGFGDSEIDFLKQYLSFKKRLSSMSLHFCYCKSLYKSWLFDSKRPELGGKIKYGDLVIICQ